MPVKFEPLHKAEEYKELKTPKMKKLLAERIAIYQQQKRIAARLEELNFELFLEGRSALPDDVKSVEFEGHVISMYQGDARLNLNQKELMTKEFGCPHPCCVKAKKKVTLPAKVLEACKHPGKTPKPTVSVRKVGEKEEE